MYSNLKTLALAALAAVAIASCGDDNEVIMPPAPSPDPAPTPTPTKGDYSQQYRPQVHFTPARNWMNDPNGMVYVDGVWHLFYQYNPAGNNWGNMSWGHATSADLMHWDEQPVALTRDNLGDIFSGSAVIDKNNTAGLGSGAMICLYTSSGARQQQSMAYSTDGGKTFSTYVGNPIIGNTDKDDFRDPKVFWHEDTQRWIMSLARGWQYAIDFYSSADLKHWEYLSSFSTPEYARCNKGQWECPDLMQMQTPSGEDKWVLIVSTNPGGPVSGSGAMYFVGNFDGKHYTADALDYPLWLDYGMDNYAGVTWSNTPGRHVFIGWMNNWSYSGDVPCSPWRSAMTLPRELSLQTIDGKPYLCSPVVSELSGIAGEWQEVSSTLPEAQAYHVQVSVPRGSNHTIVLSNAKGEHYDIEVKGGAGIILARRNAQTGRAAFNTNFAIPAMQAPLRGTADTVTLDLYIDQSSVEVITADGSTSITNLVFPTSVYNKVEVDGSPAGRVRTLSSIWR